MMRTAKAPIILLAFAALCFGLGFAAEETAANQSTNATAINNTLENITAINATLENATLNATQNATLENVTGTNASESDPFAGAKNRQPRRK